MEPLPPALLPASVLGSLARKEHLLEGDGDQAGVMTGQGGEWQGLHRTPLQRSFAQSQLQVKLFLLSCSEPTPMVLGLFVGRIPSPSQDLALPAKGFWSFTASIGLCTRCLIAAVPALQGPFEGPKHVSLFLAGTHPWGAGRGSPHPPAPGLPQKLSPPARPSASALGNKTGTLGEFGDRCPGWSCLGFIHQLGGKGQEQVAAMGARIFLV